MDALDTSATDAFSQSIAAAEASIIEAADDAGLEPQSRAVCRIVFEEYLRAWLKTATTKTGLVMRKEALDELVKCSERFADCYDVPPSGLDSCTPEQRQIFKDIMYGPGLRRLKKQSEKKRARVNQLKRIYLLCRTPDPLTQHDSALRDAVVDPEAKECWESEVDRLVAWTHSLSFEELDKQ